MKTIFALLFLMILHVELSHSQEKALCQLDENLGFLSSEQLIVDTDLGTDLFIMGNNVKSLTCTKTQSHILEYYYTTASGIEDANELYEYQLQEEPQVKDDQAFAQLASIKDVEVVYISKALIGSMSNLVNLPGVDVKNTIKELNSIQIYSSEKKKTSDVLRKAVEKIIKQGNYETLMLVKDEDSQTAIYQRIGANSKIGELLMVTIEDSEVNIIRMIGKIDLENIKKISKK